MAISLVDDYRGVGNGSQAVVIPARKTFTESDNWGIGAYTICARNKHGYTERFATLKRID